MKMEDKEIYECAKKIKEYCKNKTFCIGCIFNTTSCSFDYYGLSTPDQWLLPESEERK